MTPDMFEKITPFIEARLTEGASRQSVALALIGAGSALFAPVDSPVPDNDELVETFLKVRIAFPLDQYPA